MSGPNVNTPTNMSRAPTPTHGMPAPDSPATKLATPSAESTPPSTSPRRTCGAPACTTLSRIAASGGTRDARIDGNTAEPMVTIVPTTIATTAVRACRTVPPAGISMPKPSIIASGRPATTTPATRPMAEAVTPTITASSNWAHSTWRRVAPTDRRSAISWRRWVTMIWNVL